MKRPDPQGLLELPRGRRDFARQLAIWFGFVFGYQVARGLADRGAAEAFRNGRRVLRLEDALGTLFEPNLQRWALAAGYLLIDAMSLTYWLSQFVVVLFALLWIYLRRVDSYLPVRNTIIIANTIALIIYVAIPTAPPRLFPAWGFYDTVAASSLGAPHGLVALLANPYAAMPSLHAADAAIIGVALALLVRPAVAKGGLRTLARLGRVFTAGNGESLLAGHRCRPERRGCRRRCFSTACATPPTRQANASTLGPDRLSACDVVRRLARPGSKEMCGCPGGWCDRHQSVLLLRHAQQVVR